MGAPVCDVQDIKPIVARGLSSLSVLYQQRFVQCACQPLAIGGYPGAGRAVQAEAAPPIPAQAPGQHLQVGICIEVVQAVWQGLAGHDGPAFLTQQCATAFQSPYYASPALGL